MAEVQCEQSQPMGTKASPQESLLQHALWIVGNPSLVKILLLSGGKELMIDGRHH